MIARHIGGLIVGLALSMTATAQTLTIQESIITDFRPVVGRIEASDTAMARSRLQGVITQLSIDEGQTVKAGEVLAFVADDTIAPQINALQSRVDGLTAQMTAGRRPRPREQTVSRWILSQSPVRAGKGRSGCCEGQSSLRRRRTPQSDRPSGGRVCPRAS